MKLMLEILGAVAGITGAILMLIDPTVFAGISFSVWLVSSVALAVLAVLIKMYWLLALQLTFSVINGLGTIKFLL